MDMPEINRCFGIFPPKYACYLISLFGLGTGGVGLTGIVLYGIVEEAILSRFMKPADADIGLKKAVLLTIGLSSLLLVIANVLLFLGVSSSSRAMVGSAKWVIFAMCLFIMIEVIAAPVACFFYKDTCLIKKLSPVGTVFAYLILGAFLEIWTYFMVVTYNLQMEL